MKRFPPVEVTLPWLRPRGPKVTHRLVFTSGIGAATWSQGFNDQAWKPALASAGIIPAPEKGQRYAPAREHGMHALRHFYASVLLDAGENIKALSLHLGHSDPGFTLRVYTRLMPSSETRTRKAIFAMYRPPVTLMTAHPRTTAQRRPRLPDTPPHRQETAGEGLFHALRRQLTSHLA